jgi:hypothetical protein
MRCGHGVQEGAAAVRAEAEATRGLEGVFKVAPSSIESRWSQSRYASEHAVLLTTQVELVKPDALRLDRRVNFLVRKEQLLKRPEEQAEVCNSGSSAFRDGGGVGVATANLSTGWFGGVQDAEIVKRNSVAEVRLVKGSSFLRRFEEMHAERASRGEAASSSSPQAAAAGENALASQHLRRLSIAPRQVKPPLMTLPSNRGERTHLAAPQSACPLEPFAPNNGHLNLVSLKQPL